LVIGVDGSSSLGGIDASSNQLGGHGSLVPNVLTLVSQQPRASSNSCPSSPSAHLCYDKSNGASVYVCSSENGLGEGLTSGYGLVSFVGFC